MKKYTLFFFLAILAVSCSEVISLNDKTSQEQGTRTAFVQDAIFKCIPGTKEWAKLRGIEALKENSQIKTEILLGMSDEDLANSLLDYPLAYHYTAFENERSFVDGIMTSFNGLNELLKRQNGFESIVKCYEKIEYVPEDKVEKAYNKSTSFNLGFLELILSNDLMLEKAQEDELNHLKEASLAKYEMKISHPEYFGILSVKRSLMLCAVVAMKKDLIKDENNRKKIYDFSKSYYLPSFNDELTALSQIIMDSLK